MDTPSKCDKCGKGKVSAHPSRYALCFSCYVKMLHEAPKKVGGVMEWMGEKHCPRCGGRGRVKKT